MNDYDRQVTTLLDSQRLKFEDLTKVAKMSTGLQKIQDMQYKFWNTVSTPIFADEDTLSLGFGDLQTHLSRHGEVNNKIGKDITNLTTVVGLKHDTYKDQLNLIETDLRDQVQKFKSTSAATERTRVKFKSSNDEICKIKEELRMKGQTIEQVLEEHEKTKQREWQVFFDSFESSLRFGNLEVSKLELKSWLEEMVANLKLQTIKYKSYGLNMTMERSIEESKLASWIQENNSMRYSQVVSFLTAMIDVGFFKKFTSYQVEFYQLTEKLYQFIGSPMEKPGFYLIKASKNPKYIKQTQLDLVEYKQRYFELFDKLDKIRCDLDISLLECSHTIKLLNLDLNKTLRSWLDETALILKLDKLHEVQFNDLIQVGYYKPPVAQLFNPHGDYPYQRIFGVDLIELSLANGGSTIPLILHCILRHLDQAYERMSVDEILQVWGRVEVSKGMFELRDKVNKLNESTVKGFKTAALELFKGSNTSVVVALLHQFFLELPIPLFAAENVSRMRRIMERLPQESSLLEIEIKNMLNSSREEIKDTYKALIIHISYLAVNKLSAHRKAFINKVSNDFSTVLFEPDYKTRHWCFVFVSFCIYHRQQILGIDV
ncbi:unnamed protein product [Kuraishia capsulata CBS 1993]|uniref:Rho-GAP domain-containing protein n=1 Tax=Kuraishia capsulata CBS 1993 TaxID=1382522 RepID=W6MTC4_9ASCO|nr:uncharacterized protein KUCA_T00004429001 [Kuraishia capsulata CBS 1993]CDK28447.1 unnamed protein product [Kuraishia capsulata CBS 1993]